MKKTNRIEFGKYYHIFNRGNNKEKIFLGYYDYNRFLKLLNKHLYEVMDFYVYCLLPNHFHFLIRVKAVEELENYSNVIKKYGQKGNPEMFISQKFSNFFNAYAKYFNTIHDRTGSLFQERFGRVEIESDEYFSELILYVHNNPQKHGLIKDFREYKYSSYNIILSKNPTRIKRERVLSWFGGKDEFISFHKHDHDFEKIGKEFFRGDL